MHSKSEQPIRYSSTNRHLHTSRITGFADEVSFKDALFMGLAPDEGLFMPTRIPRMAKADIAALKGKPYHAVAYEVLRKFLDADLPAKRLQAIVKDAYDFPVPIERMDEMTWLVRLDHGPTASFKDFAARLMARLMQTLNAPGARITVLVATSGDTGSAVGEAYRGLDGVDVYILYPRQEVSPVQKRQLDSIGMNVRAIAVDGTFDDCQRLVKNAFTDADLKPLGLTSANSINIGRILPQMVYYFYAYAQVAERLAPMVFSVPSGNFGNSFGCECARRMGLPVKALIIAVNANDEFPKFLRRGVYRKLPVSINCISNAMNVGNPSNLARYFNLFGGTVDKDGIVYKLPDLARMQQHLYSTSVNDVATVRTMQQAWNKHHVLLEPHGAVGVAALERYRREHGRSPAICLETAHPAKFPEVVESALGIVPEPPPSLKALDTRTGTPDNLPHEYSKLKQYLLDRA